MLLTAVMKKDALRKTPPRSAASDMARPRPTAGAALLLAGGMSLPFLVMLAASAIL